MCGNRNRPATRMMGIGKSASRANCQLMMNSAISMAAGKAMAMTVSGMPWATKSSTVSTSPTERDTNEPTRRSVKKRWGSVWMWR